MWRHQFLFLLREGLRGLRHSPGAFLASTTILCVSAAALALLLAAFDALSGASRKVAGQNEIRVYLGRQAETPDATAMLRGRLEGLAGLDSFRFVSKEQALEEFRRDFDPGMVEGLPYNPLPPSFLVYPGAAYAGTKSMERLRLDLADLPGVEEVSDIPQYLAWFYRWRSLLLAAGGLALLLVAGALSLVVANAIQLSLYARRGVVETMKYCGAGLGFLSLPFLFEGLLQGLIGGAAGAGLAYAAESLLRRLLPFLPAVHHGRLLAATLLFTSLLGGLAAWVTVVRFVRRREEPP